MTEEKLIEMASRLAAASLESDDGDNLIPGEPPLPFQVIKHGERIGSGFNTLEAAIEYVRSLKRADIRFEIHKNRKKVWPLP